MSNALHAIALPSFLRSRKAIYFVGSTAIVAIYAMMAAGLLATQDFSSSGPLAFTNSPLSEALPGTVNLSTVLDSCFPKNQRDDSSYAYKIVGGSVHGQPYYACYQISKSSGSVFDGVVVDGGGIPTGDPSLIKAGGAWPWIGVVKNGQDLTFGGIGVSAVLFYGWLYYRRERPAAPTDEAWYRQHWLLVLVSSTCVGLLALIFWPRVSRARKVRIGMEMFFIVGGFWVVFPLLLGATRQDPWAEAVGAVLVVSLLWAILGGRRFLAPAGFGVPEPAAWFAPSPPAGAVSLPVQAAPPMGVRSPVSASTPAGQSTQTAPAVPPAVNPVVPVFAPGSLPSFRAVGGMSALKKELQDTLGLELAYPDKADEYRITWNGILMYGPPGVGKTFIAKAAAGEFGLNFLPVPAAAIASSFRGESPKNIEQAFQTAVQNLPCILFFDEFDGIAQRRDDFPDQEARRTIDQFLQSLEKYRSIRELVVMAATNDLNSLDPAVIRAGRFDRHIRVDFPDADARKAILGVQLAKRPVDDGLDLEELARRAEGRSSASIGQAVEAAALEAFQRASRTGQDAKISQADLVASLIGMGGKDRPTVEDWSWEKLILPSAVKTELQQLVAIIKDPDEARAFGVEPPTGLLLTGLPGTGKTTIAKVIAAQSKCSFYPISGADITSKWVGESEQNISRLFQRARDNQPSIIFLDEIDAVASRRGDYGSYDQQIDQLLQEIDGMSGQKGVFVIGATNRPDKLDPALLRGGRLSRTINIPPPDQANRLEMLHQFAARMPLAGVDLDDLVARTDGLAGADLKAICQQAGVVAMMRRNRESGAAEPPTVTQADFELAIADHAGVTPEAGVRPA